MKLKYGMNPNQDYAEIIEGKDFPLKILNGAPGFINILDSLNSWQLVKELKEATGIASAASFKHVNPAGAAIGKPLNETLKKIYLAEGLDTSPLSCAYLRARGADRMSSFGDFAALSDIVDGPTAKIIKREVSDGVIAPGYTNEALEILKSKKGGNYLVIQIDPAYNPPEIEERTLFGIKLAQKRNNFKITKDLLKNIITENKDINEEIIQDMLVGQIALKYTQSNSICISFDGQTIGVGAGQQSRIHCTHLAISKAEVWFLRQHPDCIKLTENKDLNRNEKDNAVIQYIENEMKESDKKNWLKKMNDLTLGSDGFIPFRDNIDLAHKHGIKYVVQPGQSIRDEDVINACNEYGMVMINTGLRLFHH